MTTYILHGGGMHEEGESNDRMYDRIVEAVPQDGTILLCYFASEESDRPTLLDRTKNRIGSRIVPKNIQFVTTTEETFMADAKTADAIIFRGGSTNRLLATLRSYPDLKEVFEGKLVMGSSAGAYALSAYNYDKSENSTREGLGFVPVRTICHYLSQTKDGVGEEAVQTMNTTHTELPLITLDDCEWKEYSL